MNIYQRKDKRWEGRVKTGEDSSGKGRFKYIYGMTRAIVEAEIRKYIEQKNPEMCTADFRTMFEEWYVSVSLGIKESTACNYRMKAEKHLFPYFDSIDKGTSITGEHIVNFVIQKREAGLKDRYISDMVVLIKSVFKFYARKYQCFNPAEGLKLSFIPSAAVKLLDSTEYTKLKSELAADDSTASLGVTLAVATGLRIGELCALMWKDIDLEKRIITVSKTIQRIKNTDGTGKKTKVIITPPKTRSSVREIPVPDCVVNLLRKHRKDDNYYIVSGNSKATEPRTMENRFGKILKNAELPSVHFHALRHMFASECIRLGIDIKTLSEILGHSRVETTLNRYVHSSIEQKTEAMNRIQLAV